LEGIYFITGRELLVSLLLKTLEIQNAGGMKKNPIATEEEMSECNKSPGGVLFYLIKKELPKQEIKKVFKRDYKARNDRKKIYKKMAELGI
jgi:hypothetical protein